MYLWWGVSSAKKRVSLLFMPKIFYNWEEIEVITGLSIQNFKLKSIEQKIDAKHDCIFRKSINHRSINFYWKYQYDKSLPVEFKLIAKIWI